jgi:hypothetical protein
MNENRSLTSIFCDDVRQEIGNKHSLMGIYGLDLFVDQIPAILPKLCIVIIISTPILRPFKTLRLSAYFNDNLLTETEIQPDSIARQTQIPNDVKTLSITAIFPFTPLFIPEQGKIRVDVETEEGKMEALPLNIRLVSENISNTVSI